jgi:transposase
VRLEHPVQQIVFQEYVDAVKQAQERARGVEEQMRLVLPSWYVASAVEAISALRGVNLITAVTVLAELGDISRFDSPRQLMAYLGPVQPSLISIGGGDRHFKARRQPIASLTPAGGFAF